MLIGSHEDPAREHLIKALPSIPVRTFWNNPPLSTTPALNAVLLYVGRHLGQALKHGVLNGAVVMHAFSPIPWEAQAGRCASLVYGVSSRTAWHAERPCLNPHPALNIVGRQ